MDIQRIARELIDRYADDAELVAAGHADTLLDLGDIEAFEIWRDIAAAIHAIRGETPHSLEYEVYKVYVYGIDIKVVRNLAYNPG